MIKQSECIMLDKDYLTKIILNVTFKYDHKFPFLNYKQLKPMLTFFLKQTFYMLNGFLYMILKQLYNPLQLHMGTICEQYCFQPITKIKPKKSWFQLNRQPFMVF